MRHRIRVRGAQHNEIDLERLTRALLQAARERQLVTPADDRMAAVEVRHD